jgi:hypothetical protein
MPRVLPIRSSCPKTLPAQAGAEGLLGLGQRPMGFFHRSTNLTPEQCLCFPRLELLPVGVVLLRFNQLATYPWNKKMTEIRDSPRPSAYSAQRLATRMTPFQKV